MSTYVPLAPGSQLLPSGYLDTCMYLGKGVTEGGGGAVVQEEPCGGSQFTEPSHRLRERFRHRCSGGED